MSGAGNSNKIELNPIVKKSAWLDEGVGDRDTIADGHGAGGAGPGDSRSRLPDESVNNAKTRKFGEEVQRERERECSSFA